MIWKLPRGPFDLSRQGLIMGVLNVTPDSFSDGGSFLDRAAAVAHALDLAAQGADIIDVGGESTRPGAEAVGVDEELRRVVPVIRELRQRSDVLISIDTSKAAVAAAAVEAGADIVNDVTALLGDPEMPAVAARSGAGVVLMHMQGEPRTMQKCPHYTDVVAEVSEFLRQRISAAVGCGMAVERLAIDPGIGFGKKPEHNRALLQSLPAFTALGRPVLIGVSRKSFLSWLADAPVIEDRFWPGVALTSYGRERGAHIFRVHDPKPHREALRMTEAIHA
jgi:dihydropteroate synthase